MSKFQERILILLLVLCLGLYGLTIKISSQGVTYNEHLTTGFNVNKVKSIENPDYIYYLNPADTSCKETLVYKQVVKKSNYCIYQKEDLFKEEKNGR